MAKGPANSISPESEPRALGGTSGVLRGYSGGTSGVLRGYIRGTLGVLSGYSSPSVVYTSICLYVDTSTWMGARATPWHRALDRENRLRA